jgi:hypothetical protein
MIHYYNILKLSLTRRILHIYKTTQRKPSTVLKFIKFTRIRGFLSGIPRTLA